MPLSCSGFTLIELIVALGLFAIVMTITTGAYLIMIGINRQAQAVATGVDSLSFALETMTRTIRTGTGYSCSSNPGAGVDCTSGWGVFSVTDANGDDEKFSLSSGAIQETTNGGTPVALTDAQEVKVTSLTFYAYGTKPESSNDYEQPRVTISISGTVSSGPGKTEPFTIETLATMRGSDL